MIESGYKSTLNLVANSVFEDIPLQWIEQFGQGLGQIVANIERANVEYAELHKDEWAQAPETATMYADIHAELSNFAGHLTDYHEDPTRGSALYDFVNSAKALFLMVNNYGLNIGPLDAVTYPFKVCGVAEWYATGNYVGLVALKTFNSAFAAAQKSEISSLLASTKSIQTPVDRKNYEIEISDPDFRAKLKALGFDEKIVRTYPPVLSPGENSIEDLNDQFNQFVGDINAKIVAERDITDAAVASARQEATTQVNAANTRIDGVISTIADVSMDLANFETGVTQEIASINSETSSINSRVDAVISRVGDAESAILTEQTTRANADSALSSSITLVSARVDTANAAILTEQTARADAISAVTTSVNALVARVDGVDASIISEQTARSTADAALTTNINQIAARTTATEAAIISEQTARATAISAEAAQRDTLAVQLRGNYTGTDTTLLTTGLIYSERNARIEQDTVITNQINLVSAQVTATNAAILAEQTARASADAAEATNRESLTVKLFGTTNIGGVTTSTLSSGFLYDQQQARVSAENAIVTNVTGQIAQVSTDVQALIQQESTTRANADSAITSNYTALQSTVNGNTANISQLSTAIAGPDGLSSQWAVKTNLGGNYITGFGLASTAPKDEAPYSQFTVLADSFALVTPSVNNGQPTVPFYIGTENGLSTLKSNLYSDWAKVSGTGRPQDNATVGATFGVDISGKITPSNIATYIDNLSVNTLQIAGNAVTMPVGTTYSEGGALFPVPENTSVTGVPTNVLVSSISLSNVDGAQPIMLSMATSIFVDHFGITIPSDFYVYFVIYMSSPMLKQVFYTYAGGSATYHTPTTSRSYIEPFSCSFIHTPNLYGGGWTYTYDFYCAVFHANGATVSLLNPTCSVIQYKK